MTRVLARILVGVATVGVLAASALGQAEPPKPPPIQAMQGPSVIVYYLIGFAGLAVCVLLAAFPGRRSFED
jgi:hypothetical protein